MQHGGRAAGWGIIGGTVLVTDLRLLGVLLKDIPSETITKGTHSVSSIA